GSFIWIESESGNLVKSEKKKKSKPEFEKLLEKEKRHQESLKDKFGWAKEIEEKKKKEIEEIFINRLKDDSSGNKE
ncbi:MAG TPA: hypothetical protein VJC03_02695, partial [bacterium]|nr:hypothetical protein [bacterium]